MATQTGSIDFTTSNSVKLAAEAGWQSDLDSYYTKSEIDVTVGGINSTVSTKVGEDEVISSINQSSESVSINANKINLTGAVTISDLATDASTALTDAAKTATSYVTEITGQNGIMVHPSTDQLTGVRIASDVDIRQGNVSIANFGELDANDNPTARVGKADSKHVLIDPDYVYIMDGSASSITQLAKFGDFIRLGSDTDPMLDIRDGWMYFYPTADDVQSLYFGPTTRIQRLLNGSLKLQSDNGAVSLYGQTIGVAPANGTNTFSTAPGTVLWSGAGWAMTASHTATLAYNVSTCPTGIVLHWQAYVNGAARNQDQCYCFVPKTHVSGFAGGGVQMPLMTSGFGSVGCKYVYVYDDRVTGAANNNQSGTASGITYNNAYWVLTQIIAV